MIQSMSQRAICYDNAVAESFFNSLKNELPDHRSFKPLMKQRRRSLTILSFYNRKRRHQALDYI